MVELPISTADWKIEKHVPVIEVIGTPMNGRARKSYCDSGKEIPHPNTNEHHIAWFHVYFLADEEKFPWELGKFEFVAHGASTQGPDTSSVYTIPEITTAFNTDRNGTIIAMAYCNIHGLWKSTEYIELQQQ